MNRIRQALGLRTDDTDAGLSLIEVIVAMMIFAIISVSVAFTITNSLVLTRNSQSRETAINVASQVVDLYRSYDNVFDVENKVGSVDKTVGGKVFHVDTTGGFTQATTADTSTTVCSLGTGTLQFFHVTVKVTWDGMGASAPVYSDTQIAPNSRINNNTQGTIIVAVTGASGAGVSGVAVSAVPQSGTTTPAPVTTDAKGCAYLLKVDPGDYDVQIAKSNYIDITQDTTPDIVKTVKAGASVAQAFTYDLAGKFSYLTPNGAIAPTNLAATFFSTSGAYATAANPASLFPFPDGYRLLAGGFVAATGSAPSCINVDPGSWTTAASDGAVGVAVTDKEAALPGAQADRVLTVAMGQIAVSNVTKNNYLTAVTVTSPPLGSGDPGCSIVTKYTFPQFTSGSGKTTIELPFGSYSIYQGSSSGSTPVLGLMGSLSLSINSGSRGQVGFLTGIVTLDPRTK